MSSNSDTAEAVWKIVKRVLSLKKTTRPTYTTSLSRLGADSLDLMEIGMLVEKEFGLRDQSCEGIESDWTVTRVAEFADAAPRKA